MIDRKIINRKQSRMIQLLSCGCRPKFTICELCSSVKLITSTEFDESIRLPDSTESNQSNLKACEAIHEFINMTNKAELSDHGIDIDVVLDHYQTKVSQLSGFTYLKQPHVKLQHRSVLIAWLTEVGMKMQLRDQCVFTAVQLLDRIAQIRSLTRRKLQLLGATCLYIGSKLHEVYPIEVTDLVMLSDQDFTGSELTQHVLVVLKILKWELYFPTSYDFIQGWIAQLTNSVTPISESTYSLIRYLLLLSLFNSDFLPLGPDQQAAVVLLLSLHESGFTETELIQFDETRWNPVIQTLTGYSITQLTPIGQSLYQQHLQQSRLDKASSDILAIHLAYRLAQNRRSNIKKLAKLIGP